VNGRKAALYLCAVCAVLAILLLTGTMKPMAAGGAFAAALVVLGVVSGGFRARPT